MTAATAKRASRKKMPIYLTVRKLVDPDTGELIGALTAIHPTDKKSLRDRKYSEGDEVRALISKPRNPKFHRLVMGALNMVLENQDALHTIDQLLLVVKIKLGLVETIIDPHNGKSYFIPQSIAFDAMDEGDFHVFWKQLCTLIEREYLPGMTREKMEELLSMMGDA